MNAFVIYAFTLHKYIKFKFEEFEENWGYTYKI